MLKDLYEKKKNDNKVTKEQLFTDLDPNDLTEEEILNLNAYMAAAMAVQQNHATIEYCDGWIGHAGENSYTITKLDNKWHVFFTNNGEIEKHRDFNDLSSALKCFITNEDYLPFEYVADAPITDIKKSREKLLSTFLWLNEQYTVQYTVHSLDGEELNIMKKAVEYLIYEYTGYIGSFINYIKPLDQNEYGANN